MPMLTALGTMLATGGFLRLLAGVAVSDREQRRRAWLGVGVLAALLEAAARVA